MSMSLTSAFIGQFATNIADAYARQDSLLRQGVIGRIEGMTISRSPLSAEQRCRQDIEAVREALKRARRRERRHLEKRLRRMEDKYAQRALLGWDWLNEHPDHPLHIQEPLDVPEVLLETPRTENKLRLYNRRLTNEELQRLTEPVNPPLYIRTTTP